MNRFLGRIKSHRFLRTLLSALLPTLALANPTITTHPINQSVIEGRSVTFSVSATGSPQPTYQWLRDEVSLPGATSSAFTIPAAYIEDDDAEFKVQVTNSNGTTTSAICTLNVTPRVSSADSNLAQWPHVRAISINTKASGANTQSDVHDFPVAIRLSKENFRFSQARTDGQDIRFSKADGSRLHHEIEHWNSSACSALVWVRLDTVKANDSTQAIRMYWGKLDAEPDNHWTAIYDTSRGFGGAWHLNEKPNDFPRILRDRTAFGCYGIGVNFSSQGWVPAVLGRGTRFDGSNDHIILGTDIEMLKDVPAVTFSSWVYLPHITSKKVLVALSKYNGSTLTNDSRFAVYMQNYKIHVEARAGDAEALQTTSTVDTIAANTWVHLAAVVDYANDSILVYFNGVRQTTTGSSSFTSTSTSATVSTVGAFGSEDYGASTYLEGRLDEIQISRTKRSPDWIKLAHSIEKSGSAILTMQESYQGWAHSRTMFMNTTSSGANIQDTIRDFPLLVRVDSSTLAFSQVRGDASDLRFSSSSGAPLPTSIQNWDSAGQTGLVWVKVDTILGNNDTQSIQMHWGNASTIAGARSVAVFDSGLGYGGVWHLDENPGGGADAFLDPTFRANHGTTGGGMALSDSVTGVVGRGVNFDGINDYLNVGDSLDIMGKTFGATISAWVKMNSLPTTERTLIGFSVNGSTPRKNARASLLIENKKLKVVGRSRDQADVATVTSVDTISAGNWRHVTGRIDFRNETVSIFVDGEPWATTGTVAFLDSTTNSSIGYSNKFAAYGDLSGGFLPGALDEVHVSREARSDDWIALTYENQRNGSDLLEWAGSAVVSITSPVDGYITNEGTIPVEWRVNGVIQGTSTSEVLENEGPNTVERCFDGNCDAITVIRDQSAPVVVITSPSQDTTVGVDLVLVQFTVDYQNRSRSVHLNPGLNSVVIDTLDAAGNRGSDTVKITYVVPTGAPVWPSWSHLSISDVWPSSMKLAWTPAVDDSGVSKYRIYREGVLIDSVPGNRTHYTDVGLWMDHPYLYKVEAGDLRGNWTTNGPDSVFTTSDELPPNPEEIAPPILGTVSTTMFASASFLFENSIPIQTGMEPMVIDTMRAAVLRGIVKGRNGSPLSGVSISVLGGKSYGSTVTRGDGEYDLIINGGGITTIKFAKAGYLPAQRRLDIPWRRFVNYPEVILIELDTVSHTVALNSSGPMQEFRAGIVTDEDGSRRATILIPSSTTAQKVFPNGTTQSLDSITLRATEYTVGVSGPKAMPADLPHTSAYTYAVEYSVDQAMEEGISVVFNQPIYSYLENFVGLPVGWSVPAAYYDRGKGHWVPSQDGRVIKIHSISGGRAELVIDGTGSPADSVSMAVLGITDVERVKLASLYSSGDSLWRVPVQHFSPWDFNLGMSRNGPAPKMKKKKGNRESGEEDEECGSVIGCQTQTLGENISITGTPYTLHYRSDRVKGRREAYQVEIQLSDSVLPSGIQDIQLEIGIAGRFWVHHFTPAESLSFTFEWDGLDAYGRELQGQHTLTYLIGYGYNESYLQPPNMTASFGFTQPIVGTNPVEGRSLSYSKTGYTVNLGTWNNLKQKLGGWSVDAHHSYDVSSKTLYMGNGKKRAANDFRNREVVTRVAGKADFGFSGDNGPAILAELGAIGDMEFGPDGSLYFVDWDSYRVRKINGEGIISTIAGNGSPSSSGDGGSALDAGMAPYALSLGQDGSLFIADWENNRIRKVDPRGNISTIAGTGIAGFSGDGGPASLAKIDGPFDVHVGSDGSLYIADFNNNRVRKVSTNGIIQTIGGNGDQDFLVDSVPAIEAAFIPHAFDMDQSGNLYVADQYNARLFKISIDGILSTVAGTGSFDATGDGGLAIGAGIQPVDVKVAIEGDDEVIYVADYTFRISTIRKIDVQGNISTIAGGADWRLGPLEARPATGQSLDVFQIVVDKNGYLYFSGLDDGTLRKIRPALPEFGKEAFMIASETGDRVFSFDAYGRHLKTRHGLTGAALHTFEYDSLGLLNKIIDGAGNEVILERNVQGDLERIVSPYGQGTEVDLNSTGYLVKARNPAEEEMEFEYTPSGLLTEYLTPKNMVFEFTYDSLGRLIRDDNPAGGYKELEQVETENGRIISLSTSMGRVKSYFEGTLPTGESRKVNVDPAGLVNEVTYWTDGLTSTLLPDSSSIDMLMAPDPRFGMQSAFPESSSVLLPSGMNTVVLRKSSALLADSSNPFSIQTLSDTIVLEGKVFTSSYHGPTRLRVLTSPEGKVDSIFMDSLGRTVERRVPGLERVFYSYDSRGRLETVSHGQGGSARITQFNYNSLGHLSEVEDAEGRTFQYTYDAAGRVIEERLPDGRVINKSYDADGIVASIEPPGRDPHYFAQTSLGLDSVYLPPSLGSGNWNTLNEYNLDRQLLAIDRPEGRSTAYRYDSAGRIDSVISPEGSIALHYAEGKGLLDSVTSPYGVTLAYQYNGPLVTEVSWLGQVSGSVELEYNDLFFPTSQILNGTDTLEIDYDLDGHVVQIGNMELLRDSRNARVIGTSLGTVHDTSQYTGFGEVENYLAKSNGDTLYHSQLERDKLGRVMGKIEKVQGTSVIYEYSYDPAGRLRDVVLDGTDTTRYSYDSNGNRLAKESPLGVDSGHYDGQDRQLDYAGLAFTYNRNGDLESQIDGSDTTEFSYDVFGNLIWVQLQNGTEVEYLFDGQNRMVGRKLNGILVQGYLYQNQLEPLAELDGTGTVVSRFIYGSRSNVPDFMVKGGVTYRIISDHLGSPRLVVNTINGSIAQRLDYNEFGLITYNSNPGFQPFGFAGGLVDPTTGLVRFGARDYSPRFGRWMSKDPIRFEGGDPNLFAYAFNDPINRIDANGMDVGAAGKDAAYTINCNGHKIEFPPGVTIEGNISIAGVLSSLPGGIPTWAIMSYKDMPWDFKNSMGPQYEHFGNFNYGATGIVMGFNEEILLTAAGAVQHATNSALPEWGNPFTGAPYGDDPVDQTIIKLGISWKDGNCGCQ